jgi:hypothetical protein
VLVATHTRKAPGTSSEGSAGNQDTIRGAGAQTGVARIVVTLVGMHQKEAKAAGIPEGDRGRYMRADVAKGNILATGGAPAWYRWESVALGNGGDVVGVLQPVEAIGSRVKTESETDPAEALGALLTGMAPQGAPVAWKDVTFRIQSMTKMGDRAIKDWMAAAPESLKTTCGEVQITRKTGRGGTFVRLAGPLSNDENTSDFMN